MTTIERIPPMTNYVNFLLQVCIILSLIRGITPFDLNNIHKEENRDLFRRLYNLDKRVTSLEQPAWEVVWTVRRWTRCSEGPCRCTKETLTLACWRQNLRIVPRTQAIPHDIKVIDLSSNELQSLHKNTFHDLASLSDLDMSNNKLNFLPESIFESLTSLRNLKLRQNSLDWLTEGLLKKQADLEILDLSLNKLSRLDGDLLRACKKLKALNLAGNRLEDLPGELFRGLELLEDLNLSANGLLSLEGRTFAGLESLSSLDLSKNNLTYLPSGGSSYGGSLQVHHCPTLALSRSGSILAELEQLLSVLPFGLFRDTKKLEVLAASSNSIAFIERTLFLELRLLTFLDLTGNRISDMSGVVLEPGLRELHLGQNRLQQVPVLAGLPRLRRLFLFSNHLQSISSSVFWAFPDLRTLALSHNLLRAIQPGAFAPLTQLNHLQLDSNKLAHLPEDLFKENSKLTGVKLGKNPWHCDCAILNFATWLKKHKDKVWGLEPTCLGPGELGGRPIDEMTYEDLCENNFSYDEREIQIAPLITSHKSFFK